MAKIHVATRKRARCGLFDHDSKECTNDITCINCKGKHFAYSYECAKWKIEKKVQQVKVEKRLSFQEARKLVETATPPSVAAGKSYAAVAKVPMTSVSINTELTWPVNETKYKKLSDIEKTQKQVARAAQKEKENIQKLKSTCTQVSLDSQNRSSRSSTEVPGPSLPQSRKDKNSSSKDRCSGRLKKIEMKSIPISNTYDLLEVDCMDVTCHDSPQHPTSKQKEKLKLTPVLPPAGK